MNEYLLSACDGLTIGVSFGGFAVSDMITVTHPISSATANTIFRSLMPFRDYDRRKQSQVSRRTLNNDASTYLFAVPKVSIKTEIKEEKLDDVDLDNASRQKVRRLDLTEIPDVQVTKTESATLGVDKKSMTISDANTVATRESMQRGLADATQEMRTNLATLYGLDAMVQSSEVARLARTLVILLLEPVSLRIVSQVHRPNASLSARERERLLTNNPPTLDDMREMNRHITSFTVNLFAGCPEFALDITRLGDERALRAIFFFIAFGNILFLTNQESATLHVLDDFRHNSELEKRIERGSLVGRMCCALVRGVDRRYRAGLRNRLSMALDAAMSDVCAMRQPFNNNPSNIMRLQHAKKILLDAELE
jgi:hypothetical protein